MNEKYDKILIKFINNKMINIDKYENKIYNIFNKCSEKIQVDFIKLSFILNKISIANNKLVISNIGTIKELLTWGCVNNHISLIFYVFTHKNIKLDLDFYYSLEKIKRKSSSVFMKELISIYLYIDSFAIIS